MKLLYKICLVNIALAFVLSGIIAVASGSRAPEYLGLAGLVSILISLLYIFIGLVIVLFRKSTWGQGFLLSAGILLLLGFMECSLSAAL